nr:helix-turn-helix transcriptional regulator [Bifidobacterium breve]
MTQKQLADEMGVSQSYVSQIENGRKKACDIAHRLCAGSRSAHYI